MSASLHTYTRLAGCLLLAATIPSLTACGQSTSLTDCGAGEARLIGNDRYCVYGQELIIEGFECPPQMSYHEVPGGAVCSPHGADDPLPGPLQMPFEPVTTPVCDDPPCDVMPEFDMPPSFDLGADMSGDIEGSPGKTDMNLVGYEIPQRDPSADALGQPLSARESMFRRVARSQDMACVIYKPDPMISADTLATSCWGRWRDESGATGLIMDAMRPGIVDVQDVTVGRDRLCMRYGTGGTLTGPSECWRFDDQGLWVLAEAALPDASSISMHHQAGRLGTLCGLSPDGELRCEAMTRGNEVLDGLGRMEFLSMVSFSHFSVEQVQTSDDEIFACGVTTAGAVICAMTPVQGNFSMGQSFDAHTYTEVFVGERGGETVVTARRDTGELDVWKRRPTFESLQAPPGNFVELYSAFCGLQNDQVVCWDDIATEGQVGAPTVTVLYPEHPRHFDIALDATDGGTHWCAISLGGELTCSPFVP